jgi:lipid-A-disaccharide synthase-like uncharacterized protein
LKITDRKQAKVYKTTNGLSKIPVDFWVISVMTNVLMITTIIEAKKTVLSTNVILSRKYQI